MTRLTAIFAFGLTVAGLNLGGTAVAQTSAAQTITPPSLQGSFLSPEAPQAPRFDIDPATLGIAPRVEAAAPVTASAEEKAAAAKKARKIALYKQLMEENGTSKNVRLILANTKAAVRLVVLERKGAKSLSAADEIKFNEIATRVLKDAENNIINQIAAAQSSGFSEEEILTLISANNSPSAVRYNASKFANPDANAQQIQAYMVDAVVKIIKSFKESISG